MLTAPFPHPWKDNPEGCQRVAGGRSGKRGNDHRSGVAWSSTPERGARPNRFATPRPGTPGHPDSRRVNGPGPKPKWSPHGSNKSGTPPGCGTSPAPPTGGRRPEKPSATFGYRLQPSGLAHPECPNPSLLQRRGGIRLSDFGLLSAFDLRPSDLGCDEEPKDHSINARYDLPALFY
jgi:hypothetical protein